MVKQYTQIAHSSLPWVKCYIYLANKLHVGDLKTYYKEFVFINLFNTAFVGQNPVI